MKQTILLLLMLLSFGHNAMAQNSDTITYDTFKQLSQKELLVLYEGDDTAQAFIRKHYFNNSGALIFAPFMFLGAYGSGYATISMINYVNKSALGAFGFIFLGPVMLLSSGALILTTTIGILVVSKFRTKQHLYQSIKHYQNTHDLSSKTKRKLQRYMNK